MTLVQENVYRRTDAGTVGWDDELDAVLLRWHGFATSESFREHMRLCIELLEATGANKMYADARDQGAISEEDKLWSITEWAMQADAAGLDALVIVYPESVIAKMSVDSVMEQVDDDIERLITDDVTEGRNWIAERPTTATDVAVSELSLSVDPTSDTGNEPKTVERTDDVDVPTGTDTVPESATDDATTSPPEPESETETDADATTAAEAALDSTATTASSTESTAESSTDASVDPPTVAAIGGIIGLIGITVVVISNGEIPVFVSNGLVNATLLLGSAVLGGMMVGWAGAKAIA